MTYAKTQPRSLKRPVVMEGRSLSIELRDYAENIRVYLQASGSESGFANSIKWSSIITEPSVHLHNDARTPVALTYAKSPPRAQSHG